MSLSIEDIAKETRVSLGYLDREISKQHVVDFAKYCIPFELIAPYLGLSEDVIDAITEDKSSADLRRRETLKRWKSEFSIKATYRVFTDALLKCGKASSATEICRTLQKEEGERQEGSYLAYSDLLADYLLLIIITLAAATSKAKKTTGQTKTESSQEKQVS